MKKILAVTLLLVAIAAPAAMPLVINNVATNSPDTLYISFNKVNSNFTWVATNVAFLNSIYTGLPDAVTNAILKSSRVSSWTTNTLTFGSGGARYTLPCSPVTNYAGASWTVVAGNSSINYSTNGTNWVTGTAGYATTNRLWVSFVSAVSPDLGIPINPVLTNITVFTLTRPDLLGRTNQIIGQSLRVPVPTYADEVVPKSYVDEKFGTAGIWQAGGAAFLGGNFMHLSDAWSFQADGSGVLRWRYYGSQISATTGQGITFCVATNLSVTASNLTVQVQTNGVTSAPFPQYSHDLVPAFWTNVSTFTSTYPTVSNGTYSLTFDLPAMDQGFIRVASASTNLASQSLKVDLAVAGTVTATNGFFRSPATIATATTTTDGLGAGLMRWDTNYVYISVGTNQWKRAALSTW